MPWILGGSFCGSGGQALGTSQKQQPLQTVFASSKRSKLERDVVVYSMFIPGKGPAKTAANGIPQNLQRQWASKGTDSAGLRHQSFCVIAVSLQKSRSRDPERMLSCIVRAGSLSLPNQGIGYYRTLSKSHHMMYINIHIYIYIYINISRDIYIYMCLCIYTPTIIVNTEAVCT